MGYHPVIDDLGEAPAYGVARAGGFLLSAAVVLAVCASAGIALAGEGEAKGTSLAKPSAAEIRTVGHGYPDGEGGACFWVKRKDRTHVLVKLPAGIVLAEIEGFDDVFWMPDGVAVGRSAITPQGVPLLVRVPGTRATWVAKREERVGIFGLFEIDLEDGKATKLSRDRWPKVEQKAEAIVVHVPDLVETRRRGTSELLFGEMENRATGEIKQFIQMKDTETETSRLLYSSPGRRPRLSAAFFLDGETVMFNLGQTVWRVPASSGEATQVFPAPDEEK